jgi:hypothetical protein
MQPGREVNQLLLPSAEVKNDGARAYTSIPPYVFVTWCLTTWAQKQLNLIWNERVLRMTNFWHSVSLFCNKYKDVGQKTDNCARFEVLTMVVTNVVIFWDIAPCSQYVNRRFEGTYHLRLQDRKSDEQETTVQQVGRQNSGVICNLNGS